MAHSVRARCVLVVAVGLVAWIAQMRLAEAQVPTAAVGTSIQQCRNGTSGVSDCTGNGWVTGNLNAQNSLYGEGDFVPFRTLLTGLTAGTDYTLRIGYDAVESGLHAYDYLGSFDASRAPGQQVVPCDGVAGTAGAHACGTGSAPGPPSTLKVPSDAKTQLPSGSQAPGVFSAWGGQLTGASYVSPTPIDVNTTGTVERQIDLTFTAEGNTVVVAWGGHVASNLVWGRGETFLGSASGASFHMRLKSINGASTGNQDLSMHGNVIAPAPTPFTTQVKQSSVVVGDSVIDVASLSGTSGLPSGSVAFFVCFDATTRPDCSAGGLATGQSPVIVARSRIVRRRPRAVSTGAASAAFVPVTPGFYCFRAEYTPSAGVPYSPSSHTDTTNECFQATDPTTLSLTKICDPANDTGRFNLLIDGAVVRAGATCGADTGPLRVAAGPHTVSETAGTGTSLANYATMIGGDCAAGGSITLTAGHSASCTITNVRQPLSAPTATLSLNKVCQPASDEGRFDLYIDTYRFPDVGCGQASGPITLPVGAHTVSEQSGTNTTLAAYTSAIEGDCAPNGSISLTPGQSATCTITNARTPAPPTTITVDKTCLPANDSGRFNLRIDGHTAATGANIGCGASTGEVVVQPGPHTVDETAAGATDLGDYTTIFGGDCVAGGRVLVAQGEQATCTISNARKDHPFALLTVNKICVPGSDGGLFNLNLGPVVGSDEPCGGSLGPLAVPVGASHVGETAGTATNLADYATAIGGGCGGDGSITLSSGQSGICTITNSRKPPPPTSTIDVDNVCKPATLTDRFTLRLDQNLLPAMSCGQSTGGMDVGAGEHTVAQLLAHTRPGAYVTTIGGDCAANGLIKLAAKRHATCTVSHILRPAARSRRPPTLCNTMTVSPRTLIAGQRSRIRVHMAAGGKPVFGARVTLSGLGAFARFYTTASGTVGFLVTPPKAGTLTLSTQRQFGCRRAALARLAAILRPPAFTG